MLEIVNLCKKYKDSKILDNLSFIAEKGKITVLMGKNGSGKTTTFRIISGIIESKENNIYFEGKKLIRENIGYLPEERSLYQNLTVKQHIELIARLKGMKNESEINKQINKWITFFKAEELSDSKIKTLSKGNQQKIQFIIAVINNPDVLILDEPFTAMDIENVQLLKNALLLLKKENKVILLSSHQMNIIEEIYDKILFLEYGRIKEIIKKDNVLKSGKKVLEINCNSEFFCQENYEETSKGIKIICNNFKEAVMKAQKYSSYEDVISVSIRDIELMEYIGSK